jgi:hypothetical protein
MPEAQQEKKVFSLAGGLNTELNEISWPDGFSVAEANYELLSDGTRRRRRGLAAESSAGAELTLPTALVGTEAVQSYKWKNVGGDPDKTFMVHQIGADLYFSDDDTTMSGSWHADSVSSEPYTAELILNVANLRDQPMRFAQGRGHLFVGGPYIQPFYIEYNSTTDEFESFPIIINYRDYEGIDDGVSIVTEPTGAITADHRYNLRNRGWKQADMTSIFSALSKHPAKNGLWHMAYKRAFDATAGSDPDGLRSIDTAKYDAEVFGNSTAPMGSLFLEPFDTTFAHDITAAGPPIPIVSWQVISTGTTWELEITVASHSYTGGENVTIQGQASRYAKTGGKGNPRGRWNFNGSYPVLASPAPTATTFNIDVTPPPNWDYWLDQNLKLGEVGGSIALAKSDGSVTQRGFRALGFHAGRLWYAGLNDGQFADHVFFSRLVETPEAYGQCHQRNDPTDENFSSITPADGGVLVIPGMSGITDMMSIGNSLVLLGSEGAWEIAGGRGATFTATQFGVRQITNANFNSATGAISIEDSGMATGPSGIYLIAPNQFTGLLEAKNMIEETIQTKWNGYTTSQQERVQAAYDDAKKRIYLMVGSDSTTSKHNEMLVFDTRQGAWFRYTFNTPASGFGLISMVAISAADDSSSNQKMKFLYHSTTSTVQVADFEQTDYIDYDGLESPLPFLVTGYDGLQDYQRRKQAPVISVIQKRTETGYNAALDTAINDSSTLMTAFWDWTEAIEWDDYTTPTTQQPWTGTANNHGVSGKIGAQSQVYRHNRGFVPLATSDVDGYPIIVTRNKVRGRGRVLQLRFDGAATKDSQLIGWRTNYKVSRRK